MKPIIITFEDQLAFREFISKHGVNTFTMTMASVVHAAIEAGIVDDETGAKELLIVLDSFLRTKRLVSVRGLN